MTKIVLALSDQAIFNVVPLVTQECNLVPGHIIGAQTCWDNTTILICTKFCSDHFMVVWILVLNEFCSMNKNYICPSSFFYRMCNNFLDSQICIYKLSHYNIFIWIMACRQFSDSPLLEVMFNVWCIQQNRVPHCVFCKPNNSFLTWKLLFLMDFYGL